MTSLSAVPVLRVARLLHGRGAGGRWEIPLLAAVAALILSLGSAPFVAPANGFAFVGHARFGWLATATLDDEDYRTIPAISLARLRGNGDYTYTPELVDVTVHLVRTSAWRRYQDLFLGSTVRSPLTAGQAVLDQQTARALDVRVGGKVVVLAQMYGDANSRPVELVVGSVVPAYTDPGTTKTGLLAVTGQQMGGNAVAAIDAGARPMRLGLGDPAPEGATSQGEIRANFLSALLPPTAGPASSSTLLLGGLLWVSTLRRYARRMVDRDRRSVALLVALGSPGQRAARASLLPFVGATIVALVVGVAVADWLLLGWVQGVSAAPIAFVPLFLVLLTGIGLVGYRTYRQLRFATYSDHLALSLTEDRT